MRKINFCLFQKSHIMPRLILNTNTKKENVDNLSKTEWLKITVSTGFLIFVYFIFSIGLTFYQRWFLKVCIVSYLEECSVLFLMSHSIAELQNSTDDCYLSSDREIYSLCYLSMGVSMADRRETNNSELDDKLRKTSSNWFFWWLGCGFFELGTGSYYCISV